MTYQYLKDKGWIGFCDKCNMVFKPYLIRLWNKKPLPSEYPISLNDFNRRRLNNLRGFCKTCFYSNHWSIDKKRVKDVLCAYFYRIIDEAYVV